MRARLDYFIEQIRFCGVAFQMWITLAAGISHFVVFLEAPIVDAQFDW